MNDDAEVCLLDANIAACCSKDMICWVFRGGSDRYTPDFIFCVAKFNRESGHYAEPN